MGLGGAHLSPTASKEEAEAAVKLGAKLLRLQMTIGWDDPRLQNREKFLSWIRQDIKRIKSILDSSARFRSVICIHSSPGGWVTPGKLHAIFDDPFHFTTLKFAYDELIAATQNYSRLNGYIYINEPAADVAAIRLAHLDLYNRYKSMTPRHIFSTKHCHPAKYDTVVPKAANISKCGINVHMYYPSTLTHQGVGTTPTGRVYPSKSIYKKKLEAYLAPIQQYPEKLALYVGEFAVSRFAASATRQAYYRDVIDILNKRKAHWTYHAFREWNGWDVESDKKLLQIIQKGWKET